MYVNCRIKAFQLTGIFGIFFVGGEEFWVFEKEIPGGHTTHKFIHTKNIFCVVSLS